MGLFKTCIETRGVLVVALACLMPAIGCPVRAQETPTLEATAPPNQAVLRSVPGGAYFVARDLKEQYDDLLARVERLQADVAAGNVAGDEALRQLGELQEKLDVLRTEIEARKVLVTPVKVLQQTEELSFDLGPDRRLIITADAVRVVGWEGPQVKCVLEKSLLLADDQLAAGEFGSLKLKHRRAVASDLVGQTDEEAAADEAEFLAAKRDQPLTAEQLARRRELVESIRSGYAPYRDFQGKEVDIIELEGLTYEQGNRQLTVDITSPGGEATMGSDWRRRAMLTVYVPKCAGVLLRGCLGGVAVEGLDAPLIATDAGSRDRDYVAKFSIVKVTGPVGIYNVPLDRLEEVTGDVTIESTVEYSNSGTNYGGGKRVAYIPPSRKCAIGGVTGNLSAWFSRVNLHITGVTGKIGVRNEAGDTVVEGPFLATAAHRVVSDSGRVELTLAADALATLPLLAVTSEGRAETNADQRVLEDVGFTWGSPGEGGRRSWRGFLSAAAGEQVRFAYFAGAGRALRGLDSEEPGLTLISRSGVVMVTAAP